MIAEAFGTPGKTPVRAFGATAAVRLEGRTAVVPGAGRVGASLGRNIEANDIAGRFAVRVTGTSRAAVCPT